jgi:hypothetical protein
VPVFDVCIFSIADNSWLSVFAPQHTQSMANQERVFEARAKDAAIKRAEEERAAELRQVFLIFVFICC